MPAQERGHRAPTMPHRSRRLTYRRLRQATPLPSMNAHGLWNRYLARLTWLFG